MHESGCGRFCCKRWRLTSIILKGAWWALRSAVAQWGRKADCRYRKDGTVRAVLGSIDQVFRHLGSAGAAQPMWIAADKVLTGLCISNRAPTRSSNEPAGSSSCDDLQGRRGGAARSPRMRSAGDAIESCEAK
jgi:hypothetical protein